MANLVMGDYALLLTAETGLDHLLLLYWTVVQRYSQITLAKTEIIYTKNLRAKAAIDFT